MRKLLLSTTALMTAAVLSSVATADVSISGMMEFSYENIDRGATPTVALGTMGASDDRFHSDQEINIKSSTKTDSGLEIGVVLTMQAAGENASTAGSAASGTSALSYSAFNAEENYMYLKGGFGLIQLGGNVLAKNLPQQLQI